MKKILLLSFLVVTCINSFAFVTQGSWRWRNDDGDEKTATWMANENVVPTITDTSQNIRLRIELYNTQPDSSGLGTSTLQYSEDQTNWTAITHDETNPFVITESPNVTDGEPTTEQLDGVDSAFEAGKMVDTSTALGQDYVLSGQKTEYEWVIHATENIQPNTTYYFRFDPSDSYPQDLPSLLTDATLPVRFVNFTVTSDNNKAKIQWTTASEQNNDHFAIERSADGKTSWQVITTTKGNGTTSLSHTYTVYDNAPLNGKNFYRIKQYDADGKWKETGIKLLTMQITKALLSVFPNPTKGNINFSLSNFKGNVTVTLNDLKGRTIHQEIIAVNEGISTYKLNLKNTLTKGMYVLQLKGEGLKTSTKVIVE